MSVERFAKFISEQVRKEQGLPLKEANKDNPHKDMEDNGFWHAHTTPEGHHIYASDETDRGESLHYAVKHPDGKVTYHDIEHGGDPVTDKELNSDQQWHSVSEKDIPNDTVRAWIHKDIHDELKD